MHVWKMNEDLDLDKEDIERTFSGFSNALLLFAEGGKGKLICKTSLKKRNDKEIIWPNAQCSYQNNEMKIISPRKKVEVSTRVTACSPCRHPARRKQPCFLGQDLSLLVYNDDHDDDHYDDMMMMMIMVMATKNIEHGQTENHLYKLPHREHPKSRAGNDEYLHLAINLDFVPLLLKMPIMTWIKQMCNNNSLTNSRLLLKYWPTIKVAASRAIPTPTPVCYKW